MSGPARRSKWDQAPTSATSSGLNEGYGGSYSAVDVGSGPQASNSSGPHSQVPASDAASRAAAFLSSTLGTSASASASAAGGATGPRGWVPPGHPDFVAAKPVFSGEVNINGCRPEIRYTMTSRETFDMIEEEYGATVITRGTFKQSEVNSTGGDWSNLAPEDKPLHLYVTADSQDKVDRACTRLKTLLERPSTTPSGLLMNKVYIPYAADVDPAFSLPGKIIGPGGSYVKHIQTTSGCKVHLRGKGSSYFEANSRAEAPEALHLFITGPTEQQVQNAKHLSEQLIASVKKKYDLFLAERKGDRSHLPPPPSGSAPNQHSPHQGPHGGPPQHYNNGDYNPHAQPPPPSNPAPPPPPSTSNGNSNNNGNYLGPQTHPQGGQDRPRSPYGQYGNQPSNSPRGDRAGPGAYASYPSVPSGPSGPSGPAAGAPNAQSAYGANRGPQATPAGQHPSSYGDPQSYQPNTAPPAAQQQQQQQAYSEWTPEAIAAYYAYYGMPIPPQAAQYMQQYSQQAVGSSSTASAAQQPPPPPPPSAVSTNRSTAPVASNGASDMDMEMDMSDGEDEVIVTAKGKRLHVADDDGPSKRGKYAESSSESSKAALSGDQTFWSSTQSK